jgi:hypothetical protein
LKWFSVSRSTWWLTYSPKLSPPRKIPDYVSVSTVFILLQTLWFFKGNLRPPIRLRFSKVYLSDTWFRMWQFDFSSSLIRGECKISGYLASNKRNWLNENGEKNGELILMYILVTCYSSVHPSSLLTAYSLCYYAFMFPLACIITTSSSVADLDG